MVDNRKARTPAFGGGGRSTVGTAGKSRELIFEIAGHPFALSINDVVEIVPMPLLTCEPGEEAGPSVLAGILNLGGSAVPVLHTSRLLDIPGCTLGLHTTVIIVRARMADDGEHECLGLLADAVRGIATIDADQLLRMPTHSLSTEAVRIDEQVVPIISLAELLLAQERMRIEELRLTHQRRLNGVQGVCT